MLSNHVYNLMHQLIEESKSLWRIEQFKKDTGGCDDCLKFWEDLEKDKEKHISDLEQLIKKEMSK